MSRPLLLAALLASMAALAACTEKPQELHQGKATVGSPAFAGPATPFTDPGWKVGDRDSWAQAVKQRTSKQNEYVRIR